MNTYSTDSTYGPWPENPDADYLLADLIEALALERVTLERESFRPLANTRLKSAPVRDRSALSEAGMIAKMEQFSDGFKRLGMPVWYDLGSPCKD
jgi:hypothetical protein